MVFLHVSCVNPKVTRVEPFNKIKFLFRVSWGVVLYNLVSKICNYNIGGWLGKAVVDLYTLYWALLLALGLYRPTLGVGVAHTPLTTGTS